MRSKIAKTVLSSLAFLLVLALGLLFAVPATSDAIKDLTAAQYIGFNGDALTFSAEMRRRATKRLQARFPPTRISRRWC